MMKHRSNISLKPLHSFQLPYYASEVTEITSEAELERLEGDFLVLGEGSNTIFTCDFDRPIVRILLDHIHVEESADYFTLRVGAGVNWHALVSYTLEHTIPGFENLALIPGSVGAAPVQNIGAYGVEVGEYINSVKAWDRQTRRWHTFNRESCEFAYRDSIFKRSAGRYLITEVEFCMPKAWVARLNYGALKELPPNVSAQEIMQAVIAIRNSKLPNPDIIPNAGSFFKNPVIEKLQFLELQERFPAIAHYPVADGKVKLAAGWLIDQLGLKGFRCGGAAVHAQQALVLVNQNQAKGEDVLQLAGTIQARVAEVFGVNLEAEVRLMDSKGLMDL
ncbi:UDP-N-acetylmuramate dehydrogenase [Pseudidiomarina insulisalsae]|uniref:UDP-N-acetylenolpyruvoylglucosamine reductase n=1 Tax=Pseudidiomarina insulisalsae TaxID=575789 RepID=A0A432YHM5_9GAMM|nr:UDP-N-acetylmuramate dehydrogenase [Pseudidiomarina insulisalsae]RUO60469.1 UDP-N-acetylenolpyruvoylglucosamine reductase [Pseudidiomarina insulisalsae]